MPFYASQDRHCIGHEAQKTRGPLGTLKPNTPQKMAHGSPADAKSIARLKALEAASGALVTQIQLSP